MSGVVRRLSKALGRMVGDDNLDLYALASVGVVFTVLGATGVSDVKVLSSVVLGLLAMLAFSQIKSRKLTSRLADGQVGSVHLRRDFPPDLISRRAVASDILLVGMTMTRTVQGLRTDLPSILRSGGRVRVAVLDPDDDALIALANRHRHKTSGHQRFRQRALSTVEDLIDIRNSCGGGRLEVRVLATIPTSGICCVDTTRPHGLVSVQHYEFQADGEAAPIMLLTSADSPWFEHIKAEAERLWDSGAPWPRTSPTRHQNETDQVPNTNPPHSEPA